MFSLAVPRGVGIVCDGERERVSVLGDAPADVQVQFHGSEPLSPSRVSSPRQLAISPDIITQN
jgi:hypothetical protein